MDVTLEVLERPVEKKPESCEVMEEELERRHQNEEESVDVVQEGQNRKQYAGVGSI